MTEVSLGEELVSEFADAPQGVLEQAQGHIEARWLFFTDIWTQDGFKFGLTLREGARSEDIPIILDLAFDTAVALHERGFLPNPPPVAPRRNGDSAKPSSTQPARSAQSAQPAQPAASAPAQKQAVPKSSGPTPGAGYAIVDDTSAQVSDEHLKAAPDGNFYHRVGKLKILIDPEQPDKPKVEFHSNNTKWKRPLNICPAWKIKEVLQRRYPQWGDDKYEFLGKPAVIPCKWIIVLSPSEKKSSSGQPYKDLTDIIIPGVPSVAPEQKDAQAPGQSSNHDEPAFKGHELPAFFVWVATDVLEWSGMDSKRVNDIALQAIGLHGDDLPKAAAHVVDVVKTLK